MILARSFAIAVLCVATLKLEFAAAFDQDLFDGIVAEAMSGRRFYPPTGLEREVFEAMVVALRRDPDTLSRILEHDMENVRRVGAFMVGYTQDAVRGARRSRPTFGEDPLTQVVFSALKKAKGQSQEMLLIAALHKVSMYSSTPWLGGFLGRPDIVRFDLSVEMHRYLEYRRDLVRFEHPRGLYKELLDEMIDSGRPSLLRVCAAKLGG